MITEEIPAPPFGRLLPGRMGRAAVVGVFSASGTIVAIILMFIVLPDYFPLTELAMMSLLVGIPGGLCWPAFYLCEIRPAWPVAVIGMLFVGAIWHLTQGTDKDGFLGIFFSVLPFLGGFVAYPLAVVVATPRAPVVWRAAPLVLLAGIYWFAA
ncbi:hypothetical protein [Nonomuraea sp. NPDC049028]|uniref:hypothetical protein n=1 Tax=Nonomuraea sp. NPDC049028 TaxID=3364348 RepID=UPI003719BA78